MCSYAEFCPCFAHSLNLAGSCAVEANTAATNFFLMIQQLYKFFSSSTYLWEKFEDILKNRATKRKLLVAKRPSDTRWSARYDAVRALALGCDENIDLLKAISVDEGNRGEMQTEAKELVKRLRQLEKCILLTMWNTLLKRFQQTSSALQREWIDLNTAVYLLESLQVYVRGFRERYRTFEDLAKEKKWKANLD